MTSVRVSGSQTARLVRCLVGALLACGCGAGEDRSPRAETGAHAIESLGLLVEAPIGADAIDTDWGVTFAHADARFTVTVLGELDVTTLVEAVADSFLHFRARSVEREEFSGGWLISHEGIHPDVPSKPFYRLKSQHEISGKTFRCATMTTSRRQFVGAREACRSIRAK
jgi:hypothetical protein